MLIPKPGTTKLRPIAVGTCFYRLFSKLALKKIGGIIGQKLAPIQIAVGIPDGQSIAAKLIQTTFEEKDHLILSVDLSNAFNTIRRRRILEGLHDHGGKQLIPFFKWSYKEGTSLRASDGRYITLSETGTRQGDPLSMLYFSIGIHSRLLLSLIHISEPTRPY